MGDGVLLILGILIGILIIISVGLSFVVFVTGGLTKRSICYAVLVILLAGYSIVGFVYTNTDIVTLYTVMASDIIVPSMAFFMFASALSLKRLPKKQFFQLFFFAMLPVLIFWSNWIWRGSLSLSTDLVYINETGEKITVYNSFLMTWEYLLLVVYWIAGLFTYSQVIKENHDQRILKRVKMARLGLAVGFAGALGMELLVGVVPYAHSIGHVLLFPLVLFSYKAFMTDYVD